MEEPSPRHIGALDTGSWGGEESQGQGCRGNRGSKGLMPRSGVHHGCPGWKMVQLEQFGFIFSGSEALLQSHPRQKSQWELSTQILLHSLGVFASARFKPSSLDQPP